MLTVLFNQAVVPAPPVVGGGRHITIGWYEPNRPRYIPPPVRADAFALLRLRGHVVTDVHDNAAAFAVLNLRGRSTAEVEWVAGANAFLQLTGHATATTDWYADDEILLYALMESE